MKIPNNSRIFIIEGIPGAGKTTLHHQLKEALAGKMVYDFHEEELLFGWKHGWIEGIDELRLSFMKKFLDYLEQVLAENSNAVFILSRFHVTYYFIAHARPDVDSRYQAIVDRLRGLSAHLYVPMVSEEEIATRAAHVERRDPVWELHLAKRLVQRGYTTLTDMYAAEQNETRTLLVTQGIPFEVIEAVTPII